MQKFVTFCVTIIGGLNLCQASSDLSTDVFNLTEATSRFSHELYKELTRDLPVAVYSPFSAHAALSMAYLGARGTTADQMKSVLQLSGLPQPHVAYKRLIESLTNLRDVEVYAASGIWVNENVKISEAYRGDVIIYYNATADPRADIFTDVLGADFLEQNTSAILVNTLFFNGTWKSQFAPDKTHSGSFRTKDGVVKQVDFMINADWFGVTTLHRWTL